MSSARTQARIQNAPAKPSLTHFWTQICLLVFQVLILPLNKNRDALERQLYTNRGLV